MSQPASNRKQRSEPGQLVLFKRRGGKRRGAGRKPKGARAGSPHKARPELDARHPVHVTLRVVSAVGHMRRRCAYRAVREATLTTARREDFRIVHLSIQRDHIHLLVEAEDKKALASGMQGFQISAAKHLNAEISKDKGAPRRRGTVFPDRYHAVIITSPRQARHALSYILSNWRRHKEDQQGLARTWLVDPFSSGISFPDWAELSDKDFMWPIRETYDPLIVRRPASWLLRKGWKLGGPEISAREVPGPR
jgi:REP element-mobilizing transposase RayT